MAENKIGIKLADGTFFPILTENVPAKKELELTTVRDKQTTVQVNLYKTSTGLMDDADYVDTLLIANLVPHGRGEPTIKLGISLDDQNVLSAEAVDTESGGSSNITVSLVTLTDYELSDDIDFDVTGTDDFSPSVPLTSADDAPVEGTYTNAINDFDYLNKSVQEKERKPFAVFICVICAVVSLAVLAVMLFFYFRVPRPAPQPQITEVAPPPAVVPAPPAVTEAVEDKIVVVEAPAVVPSVPAVSEEKPQEVRYKIKWGDTLWDLSEAYYKTPWRYPQIAKANKIKNPDYIISGTWIVIPPK